MQGHFPGTRTPPAQPVDVPPTAGTGQLSARRGREDSIACAAPSVRGTAQRHASWTWRIRGYVDRHDVWRYDVLSLEMISFSSMFCRRRSVDFGRIFLSIARLASRRHRGAWPKLAASSGSVPPVARVVTALFFPRLSGGGRVHSARACSSSGAGRPDLL